MAIFAPMLRKLIGYLDSQPNIWVIAFIFLLFAAFFTHLGMNPIMADEPTRAVPAMEMILSGDYIVPTINGVLYYNKPPFYTWILVLLFQLTDDWSEWMVRLPAVLFLLIYAYTMYRLFRIHSSHETALMVAIMFLTFGRMLIYDSFLGHIDIFYSWISFLGIYAIYHFYLQERYYLLFVTVYTCTAVGFLSKGLPSLVFTALSLGTFFLWKRNVLKLFSLAHIAGIAVFILLAGTYYFLYFQQNPDIEGYISNLWSESSKRTVAEKSWWSSISHLVLFPFDQAYHLLPWSLFAVYLFPKSFWTLIRKDNFAIFCGLMLMANIIIYWLSPDTRPRYLFMLYPFVLYFVAKAYTERTSSYLWLEHLLGGIAVLLSVSPVAVFWVRSLHDIPFLYVKVCLLVLLLSSFTIIYWLLPAKRWILLACILLVFRLGFDWFVFPYRYKADPERAAKDFGLEVARISKGEDLYLLPGFEFNHHLTYYICRERKEILLQKAAIVPGKFYICAEDQLQGLQYDTYYQFYTRSGNRPLRLVKFNR